MLDEAQRLTLVAALDRIIPRDEYPSASETGVAEYVRRILTDPGAPADLAARVAAGLRALEDEARARHGVSFHALADDAQDQILADVEAERVTTSWPIPPRAFFRTLVELAAEGYYGNPADGGNRDEIGWRMIGYRPRMSPEERA